MNSLCERELNNKPISLWNELLVMRMGLRVGGEVRSGLGVDGGGVFNLIFDLYAHTRHFHC